MVCYVILRRRQHKVPYEIHIVKSNITTAWKFPCRGALRQHLPTLSHIKLKWRHTDPSPIDQDIDSLNSTDTVRKGSTTGNTTTKLERDEVALLLKPSKVPKNKQTQNMHHQSVIGGAPYPSFSQKKGKPKNSVTPAYTCSLNSIRTFKDSQDGIN